MYTRGTDTHKHILNRPWNTCRNGWFLWCVCFCSSGASRSGWWTFLGRWGFGHRRGTGPARWCLRCPRIQPVWRSTKTVGRGPSPHTSSPLWSETQFISKNLHLLVGISASLFINLTYFFQKCIENYHSFLGDICARQKQAVKNLFTNIFCMPLCIAEHWSERVMVVLVTLWRLRYYNGLLESDSGLL